MNVSRIFLFSYSCFPKKDINSFHPPKMFYRSSRLGLNMRVNGKVKSIVEIQLVTAWASVIHSLVAAQLRMLLLVVRRGPPVLGQMAHTASFYLPPQPISKYHNINLANLCTTCTLRVPVPVPNVYLGRCWFPRTYQKQYERVLWQMVHTPPTSTSAASINLCDQTWRNCCVVVTNEKCLVF